MKTYGRVITDAQIQAGLERMQGIFRASDITWALIMAGVQQNKFVADRSADKLLQRERRAGRIRTTTNKRYWERTDAP